MGKIIVGIILVLSLLTFYLATVNRLNDVEQVAPPDLVVPPSYDSDQPAGHTGEAPSDSQPQPVYPPLVVPPICDCDGPVGHIGEAPAANQPQPVYPPDPILAPPAAPERASEGLSNRKAKTRHHRAKPRVVKRAGRNLKKGVDRRRRMVYTGKRIEPKPSPFYPDKYWKR